MFDLIVGAGVTGISYANFSKNRTEIIERENEIGGYCRTIKRNGFVWDYSGHFFHFRNPEIEQFVCSHIANEDLLHVKKSTSILYGGRYIDFPFQKNIHQLPKDEFIDCLYDLYAATSIYGKVESFKDMVYANLGKSIAEKFLIPYNEKLYACDLNSLDKDAMGRFFPKTSKEEIILNFRNQDNTSYNQFFVYPKGGAIEYVNSMVQNIENTPISLNEKLVKVDLDARIAVTEKREIRYDRLISTIPFNKLLDLCGVNYPSDLFSWNKVLVFNIGFDRKGNDRKSSWIYIPDENFIFYRIGYYDNILQTDKMSVYVEIGFSRDAEVNPEECFGRVVRDMKRLGLIDQERIVDYEYIIMDPAYVHISSRCGAYIERLKLELKKKNVYSIGRYGSWTYCSIEDNILEAKATAEEIDRR